MRLPEPVDDAGLTRIRNRAEGYLVLRMHDDALGAVAELREGGENPLFADYMEAAVLRSQGDLDAARAILERIHGDRPDLTGVCIDLAYVYRRTESVDKAIAVLLRALDIDPSFGLAYYNLACYQAVRGETTLALATLARAIREDRLFRAFAAEDEDFASIQDDPRFELLLRASDGAN